MCWRLEIWAPPWSWLVRPASPKCVPAYPRNCFYTGYRPIAMHCIVLGCKCNTLCYVCLAVPASSYAQVISPYSGGQPIPRLSSHIGSRLLRLSSRPWARCRGDREGSLLKRISTWRKNTKVHNCIVLQLGGDKHKAWKNLYLYWYLYFTVCIVFVFQSSWIAMHEMVVDKHTAWSVQSKVQTGNALRNCFPQANKRTWVFVIPVYSSSPSVFIISFIFALRI